MCEEAKWKEYLEDFLAGADGDYQHATIDIINNSGNLVQQHKLYSKTETIRWELNKKNDEITGVEHLGR